MHLLGAVSPAVLNALYARALGLVYLPLEEGFGLPPLEAMTAGTAVLASSAVPSVTECADESVPAFIVDPRDLEAMAAGIHHLVSDADGRAAIAEAGRNFAAKRRWADVASRHLELWGLA
ncbi:MAG: glycosyltransferase [Actinobacteria bacterium]|nr:glycosyltransferase [Actinomycetota bacterium]